LKSLIDIVNQGKILVSDGAWGTLLHQRGLQPGECPELWNLTHYEDVLAIGRSYIEAGADVILTNSFGGSPAKLAHYRLDNQVTQLNETAAAISREAAGDDHFVLGSVGPTGKMLMMGDITEEEMYDGFRIQIEALKKGGVDAICVETMSAIDEATLAVKAARDAGMEVAATFTFERSANGDFFTMMGVTPAAMVTAMKAAGATILGSNCGNGFDQMIEIVREIRRMDASIPILIHANAGKPHYENGMTVFPETPQMMAIKIPQLLKSGANIIGGCCGTTPAHIRAIRIEVDRN
jgi:5-methyltetrahydrofolate--homocysteine methyltransferase